MELPLKESVRAPTQKVISEWSDWYWRDTGIFRESLLRVLESEYEIVG